MIGLALVVCLATGGCKGKDSTMDYPKLITVENNMVFDSVHATLKIRNRSSEPIELDIIPECDCTRANPERVTVRPHRREEIKVSIWISSSGASRVSPGRTCASRKSSESPYWKRQWGFMVETTEAVNRIR